MKGLFYRGNLLRPMLLTTAGTLGSLILFASVVHMTGNTMYVARKLLRALGYPACEFVSPYENGRKPWTEDKWRAWFEADRAKKGKPWTEDEWDAWFEADSAKRRRGDGVRGRGEEEKHV